MSEQQKQTLEGSTKTTKNANNSRYMHSIFQECDQLKKEYDNCFNAFFQKFISPEYRHSSGLNNPCEQVHFVYRDCVEKNLKLHKPFDIDIDEVRKQVLTDLQNEKENARHMSVIASDFSVQSQEPLNQKVQTLVSGLQVLDQLKNQFVDVRVPIRLLDILDEGNNPQLFTKEALEDTRKRNKELNGKTEIYKKFQYNLIRELKLEMSADVDEYLRVRKLINGGGGGGNVSQTDDGGSSRNTAKENE
uniref:Mediator of RNA polymerase II transcription subunit 10 n=1 Tax=Meloidogyne javanica TaxID=6303 RepID=A0A915MZG7_MELJA